MYVWLCTYQKYTQYYIVTCSIVHTYTYLQVSPKLSNSNVGNLSIQSAIICSSAMSVLIRRSTCGCISLIAIGIFLSWPLISFFNLPLNTCAIHPAPIGLGSNSMCSRQSSPKAVFMVSLTVCILCLTVTLSCNLNNFSIKAGGYKSGLYKV